MFVTTADDVLEPPIITVNTVLSLLAVDYPVEKLACYVSDDGCSPLTFYSLVEATKFAKLWVPFCKKYNIQVRAPFRYFLNEPLYDQDNSIEFQLDWKIMKLEYEELSMKIQYASKNSVPFGLIGESADFSNVERTNHPSIIKVLWDDNETVRNQMPRLVYVSREKLPKRPHHYKAGAMNVLARVSGLMTNAPIMLNVDCDMYANNPYIIKHAMCLFLGSEDDRDCGFVQFPQAFYDGPEDDPFGNQMVILFTYMGGGISGIQGPFYGGTGCFHRRKIIYGMWPHDVYFCGRDNTSVNNEKLDEELLARYGSSKGFVVSVANALSDHTSPRQDLSSSIEAAKEVASCNYEYNTEWGKQFGWIYGSSTEDVLTGQTIHSMGWRSVFCKTDPLAFLGCAPSSGPTSLTQQKRWATGLLEILVSKNPILLAFKAELQFRQALCYLWIQIWALRSIPDICYSILPAYCIITNTNFLPKPYEAAIIIPVALLVIYNMYTISEYIATGISIRTWWNNQRAARITISSAWFFGFLSVILKLLGLSETVFEVTKKDESLEAGSKYDIGSFTFDNSPIFVPGTTILLVQLMALLVALWRMNGFDHVGEIVCCLWLVFSYVPFLKGMIRKGKYGIPYPTICKALVLALLFVHFSSN